MWQKLYSELQDQNFTIITVAMESRGAKSAGGPIRKSKATHPSLIDEDHLVADLYNMVNVPQAVWIDEEGRIVRPTEVPGRQASGRSGGDDGARRWSSESPLPAAGRAGTPR